jgi:hypothetical protein
MIANDPAFWIWRACFDTPEHYGVVVEDNALALANFLVSPTAKEHCVCSGHVLRCALAVRGIRNETSLTEDSRRERLGCGHHAD